jgi:hypothetical protein
MTDCIQDHCLVFPEQVYKYLNSNGAELLSVRSEIKKPINPMIEGIAGARWNLDSIAF